MDNLDKTPNFKKVYYNENKTNLETAILCLYDEGYETQAEKSATEYLALQARVEALQTAFDAACDYINHSPCDYDITPIQKVKWSIFKDLREAILKGEK